MNSTYFILLPALKSSWDREKYPVSHITIAMETWVAFINLRKTVLTYQWYILIWMDQLTGCTGCCKGSRLTCYRRSWFSCSTVCCASGWSCRLCISRECRFGGLCGCCRCIIQRFEISTHWSWNSCLSLWNKKINQQKYLLFKIKLIYLFDIWNFPVRYTIKIS